MAEYIFTNLPQYVKVNSRTEFSSSVVSSGAVLLFSEDGLTLTGKLPDGTFITIGGSSGTDVSSTTAEASDVLSGKVFYDSAGVLTSGGIQTVSAYAYDNICVVPSGYISSQQVIEVGSAILATEITPSASSQIISAGGYLLGDVVIEGDASLVASNIVSGASIFGVSGTYAGVEVTLGYITSGGQFQPLAFSGTSAADSGSAVTLSCYGWNLPGTDPSKTSSGVIISSGNTMYVDSGWTYTSTTIYGGGRLIVRNGGMLQYLSITDFNANMLCSSGGIVNYATIDSRGGTTIYGAANSTTINEGSVWIRGTANYTVINSSGSMTVDSSGLANSTTVNPGGLMVLSETGSAADILVSSGGTLTIVSGAVFTGLNNLPGAVIIHS
jgi:autotransporter passenger strand-loop-strand repeat protein